ncbi:MAG: PD-(D/E)XK nuclease family protein [Bacteroidaceae bacterium]|nr:PD-(D/E)XK nuclease family protein [Bacteroidaceae bacterium]
MQTPFLKSVAEDLYQHLNGKFDKVTIIFPNKRANLFFNQYLAELNGNRPMWLPEYATINDIFSSLSKNTVADPILLVCMLYQVYKNISQSDESLDKFYSWGEIMLSDFEDIDNNMIPADKLFGNIEELNEMTDLSFLSEEQIKAIRDYFSTFNPQKTTQLKEKFLSIWNILYPIYTEFRSSLAESHYAYEGMMKREVAEQLNALNAPHPSLKSELYAVVGFNVLSKSEKALFKHLKNNHNTFFYWDFDNAYIDTLPYTHTFEAGQFISENILAFGNRFEKDSPIYSALHAPKSINIISTSTENAQARYTSSWLRENIRSKEEALNHTAIVLCNESLLQPVVHSIPSSLTCENGEELHMRTNVTMGHPLNQTPAAYYLDLLVDLQTKGLNNNAKSWRHETIIPLLRHPFSVRITEGESAKIANKLQKDSIIYPTTEDLIYTTNSCVDPYLEHLFQLKRSTGETLGYLSQTFSIIGKSLNTSADSQDSDILAQLHTESVFQIYTLISRLTTIFESGLLIVTPQTLGRLIRQIVNGKSIPFHGDPASGIQVMGMLETRNLDFDNVLIMSANEGNLPPATSISSFIPYSLRHAFSLTTIEKRTSLFAYYLYHLMQRASNITLLYSTSTDTMGHSGEMSRFLMQTLVEKKRLFHPDTNIELLTLISENNPITPRNLIATKNDALLDKINKKYNAKEEDEGNKAKSLTPSAINTYLACPLHFYLERLSPVAIKPLNEVDEDIDNAQFGTIVHGVMEEIYKPFINRTVTSDILKNIAERKDDIARLVDKELDKILNPSPYTKRRKLTLTGQQLLNKQVIISYIQHQLQNDALACPLRIIGLEDESHTYVLPLNDKVAIRLGGIIDRIDNANIEGHNRLRIVDYKTSAKRQAAKSVEELFDTQKNAYHIRQALIYSLILSYEKGEHELIAPTLNYLKLTTETLPMQSVVSLDKEILLDFTHNHHAAKELEAELTSSFTPLFDKDIPFAQASSKSACQYCDFKDLCFTLAPENENKKKS